MILTSKQVKLMVGKRVRWIYITDPNRINGRHWRYGTITEVKRNNVLMDDGSWQWLPNMYDLELYENKSV